MEGTLVIGNGEIGQALYKAMSTCYKDVYVKDKEELKVDGIKWLHLCYPYSKHFLEITRAYQAKYKPHYTIIHSTVPVGTTRLLGNKVWHSPMRGMHPNLYIGLRTFVKYLGGEYNQEIVEYFQHAGIKIATTEKPETTELGKILDTTYYGWNIVFCKEAERLCSKYGAEFEVAYTHMNTTYNEGYKALNKSNVVRPVLVPMAGKIGGHCVIQNCRLLKEKLCKIILKFNKNWEG